MSTSAAAKVISTVTNFADRIAKSDARAAAVTEGGQSEGPLVLPEVARVREMPIRPRQSDAQPILRSPYNT